MGGGVTLPDGLPGLQKRFLENALEVLQNDARVVGVLLAGSLSTGSGDSYSDVDLVIAVEDDAYEAVLDGFSVFAASLGTLVSHFTGDHVGEPRRLLICLYGPSLLHVDLKVVKPADLARRVDDPLVLFARDDRIQQGLDSGEAVYPRHEIQWIEDRFWTWIHYMACKIGRGEKLEAVEGLSFLRMMVIAPLAQRVAGHDPNGVRRLEENNPRVAEQLHATCGTPEPANLLAHLKILIGLYLELRGEIAQNEPDFMPRDAARQAVMDYLDTLDL